MHRQRKKDLNLKPNRSLDKRSSRGMIYENEELRMRTISINEEVDRSQNDVKKLKKENEHLKREIWSLRDEYEKLEDMLKKVCVQTNYDHSEFQPMSGYRPDRRVSIGGETLLSASAYDSEDEEDCGSNIFMIDEDGKSFDYSRSIFGFGCSYEENSGVSSSCNSMYSNNTPLDIVDTNLQMNYNNITKDYDPGASVGDGSQEVILPLAVPEEDSTFENSDTPIVASYQNQHRLPIWSQQHHHSPELEVVREESENNSNSIHNASLCNTPSSLVPINLDIGDSEENFNSQKNPRGLASPSAGCTPLIEITPASSPVSQNNNNYTLEESVTRPGSSFNNDLIQDIGCVAVVPKSFQVTSELHIGNNEENSAKTENSRTVTMIGTSNKITTATNATEKSTSTGAAALPPPSPGTRIKSSLKTKGKQRRVGVSYGSLNTKQSSSDRDTANNMALITDRQCENQSQTQTMCRRHCHKRNSLVYLHGKTGRGGGSGSGSPILGLADCCPDFYSCYQSEPSLNSVGIPSPDEYIVASPIVVSTAFNGFDQSVCLCRLSTLPHRQQQGQPNWNSIDKNVAIGVLDEENMELAAQEVIDELEKQFDPSLENIAGVRMMPGRIFICLRSGDAVKKILENESFTIKGQKMKLLDACKRFSTVVLSGIPPDLSDFTVISTLNQFGQVVAPLERRIYKGVDISERICHMHLVKNLQPVLSIAGYEVRAKIISQCQELPLSAENEKQELPSTSVTNKSAESTSKNTSPRILRAPRLLQSFKNFQTTPDSKQSLPLTQNQSQQGQPLLPDLSQSEEENHRLSLQLPLPGSSSSSNPVIKTHIPILQSVSTPTHLQSQCQTLKPHKQVVRSSSSAPRLESVSDPAAESTLGSLNASILAKRQMSICAATSGNSAEDRRTSLSTNNLPPNPKKPLSRLMRSSPGSLIPQSLSGVRRGSTASMQIQQNLGSGDPGSSPTIESANNNNPNVFPGGVNSGRSRVFLHNQSQMSHQSSIPVKRGGIRIDKSYKKEPLPWCGCWGNGCI